MSQQQDKTLAELRHLYLQLVSGAVKDAAQAKRIAEGLLGPVIAKLETRAAQAQLAPLTDEQIDALWGGENVTLPQLVNRRAISRSIERAHGITSDPA